MAIISFGNWNDKRYGGGLEVGHEGLGGGGGVVEGEELPERLSIYIYIYIVCLEKLIDILIDRASLIVGI